jgi:hypothetical protein
MHLRKLKGAGYTTVTKTFVERTPHIFIAATADGCKAFEEHVAALESILEGE